MMLCVISKIEHLLRNVTAKVVALVSSVDGLVLMDCSVFSWFFSISDSVLSKLMRASWYLRTLHGGSGESMGRPLWPRSISSFSVRFSQPRWKKRLSSIAIIYYCAASGLDCLLGRAIQASQLQYTAILPRRIKLWSHSREQVNTQQGTQKAWLLLCCPFTSEPNRHNQSPGETTEEYIVQLSCTSSKRQESMWRSDEVKFSVRNHGKSGAGWKTGKAKFSARNCGKVEWDGRREKQAHPREVMQLATDATEKGTSALIVYVIV